MYFRSNISLIVFQQNTIVNFPFQEIFQILRTLKLLFEHHYSIIESQNIHNIQIFKVILRHQDRPFLVKIFDDSCSFLEARASHGPGPSVTESLVHSFTRSLTLQQIYHLYSPYSPIWSQMVPYGPLWSSMVCCGPLWYPMVL